MDNGENDFRAMRFGLGAARAGEDWSVDGMIAGLAADLTGSRMTFAPSAGRIMEDTHLAMERKNASESDKAAARMAYAKHSQATYVADVHQRLVWAATAAAPLVERLLAFWSNHFTVSARKPVIRVLAGPYEAEALLPNIGGKFADLLRAAEQHPAMLIYLDQVASTGPNSPAGKKNRQGLNENLAREILELHTLGVHGGYTQADVTEFARIMTGWTMVRQTGSAAFAKQRAEPGFKILLGRRFGGPKGRAEDYGGALDFLASQPATARHVATRLVTHFISDAPPVEAIASVEKRFVETGGDLLQVYHALAALPEASAPPGNKARNGRDFLIAALRAAEIPAERLSIIPDGHKQPPLTSAALGPLHQPYWMAASPAGWPEAAAEWLSPIGLAGRLAVIPRVVREIANVAPPTLLERALGAAAGERTRRVVAAASNRVEALSLVFASPEFNRR
jgi:uncharacterized protein (DUF1800 family)